MKNILLLLSVILLTSCGGKKNTSTSDVVLDGLYILENVQGKDLSAEGFIVTFDTEAQRVYGETGCNGFSSQFIQKASEVTFTAPISTRKYCEGKMETEDQILQAVVKVAKFEEKGEEFIFYSAEDEVLFSLTKTNI